MILRTNNLLPLLLGVSLLADEGPLSVRALEDNDSSEENVDDKPVNVEPMDVIHERYYYSQALGYPDRKLRVMVMRVTFSDQDEDLIPIEGNLEWSMESTSVFFEDS